MERDNSIAIEISELAGHIRVLAHLVQPVPHLPDLQPGPLIKMLELIAAHLDRVAGKAERCRTCPQGNLEERRP